MKKNISVLLTSLILFIFSFRASLAEKITDDIPNTNLPDPSGGIKAILDNFLFWLLGIFGVIAIIGFIISGIMYLTSAGDDDQAKNAKKAMTFSIIGIIVALSAFIIIKAIDTILQGGSGA